VRKLLVNVSLFYIAGYFRFVVLMQIQHSSLCLLNHVCFERFPRIQQLAVIKIYVARPSINERALRLGQSQAHE
jgi:hypothetical protein